MTSPSRSHRNKANSVSNSRHKQPYTPPTSGGNKVGKHQPRKRFGQHWLNNDHILDQIVGAANLQPGDRVLEIGPGRGALTKRLISQVANLVAVELDRDLCQSLSQKFGERENFCLISGDFLAINLVTQIRAEVERVQGDLELWRSVLSPHAELSDPLTNRELNSGLTGDCIEGFAPSFNAPSLNKVVANIPYNITGPILEKLLGTIERPNPQPYTEIVLLIQKEVADRLTATPGTKAFGALSIRVQYLATCELVCDVPASAFTPPPQVESAVVRLRPRSFQPAAQNLQRLASLVKVGFAQKRKMLRNNLDSLLDRDRVLARFAQVGIPPEARAEAVSLAQWVALSDIWDCDL